MQYKEHLYAPFSKGSEHSQRNQKKKKKKKKHDKITIVKSAYSLHET